MVGAGWALLLELQSEASELKRRSTLSSGVSGSLSEVDKRIDSNSDAKIQDRQLVASCCSTSWCQGAIATRPGTER
jgi:hypothetical protein